MKAPHCAFCTFGCGLLFGLQSFLLLLFLVPFPGVFPYLFILVLGIILLLLLSFSFDPRRSAGFWRSKLGD
jgi:hypothetical protein